MLNSKSLHPNKGEGVLATKMANPYQPVPPGENGSGEEPSMARQEKPRASVLRPELTRLPRLSIWRKLFRRFLHLMGRVIVKLLTRYELTGLENFPRQGPALLVVNHLGDADPVLGLAFFPRPVEALAKMELYDLPFLGWLMQAYGVIWVHRGHPDRRAIQAALAALKEDRLVGVAPEGRESLTGSLEEGTGGAAYLAIRAGVMVVPITFLGTENCRIYSNLKRLRRTHISMTVGPGFTLKQLPDRRESVRLGTRLIMERLAMQLPPEHRGVYQVEEGKGNG
jgi:1-acyl-sn-glycerol-3-phosphate acyltransferase